ncbi:ectonucleotide pyrophosphatase/phosphodiesterase family member 7-like [Glandiceps talaboti]
MPSSYTIATGLHVESHGVVHNRFYDKESGAVSTFLQSTFRCDWFDSGAEPIWVTAQKQGLKAGTHMYYGGSCPIQGVRPLRNEHHEEWKWYNLTFNERVDDVMKWLTVDELDLVMLSYNQIDTWGHDNGLSSAATIDKMREVDKGIQYLLDKLRDHGLDASTNIIITSDHGMEPTGDAVGILGYLEEWWLKLYVPDVAPFAVLSPTDEYAHEVDRRLKDTPGDILTVYKKEDLPERFHYKNNDNVLDIVLLSNPNTVLQLIPGAQPDYATDGFDPDYINMRTIFYATGPSFKKGYVKDSFESIHIYELMCRLLGLDPAPNNGSFEEVKDVLQGHFVSKGNTNTISISMATVMLTFVISTLYR